MNSRHMPRQTPLQAFNHGRVLALHWYPPLPACNCKLLCVEITPDTKLMPTCVFPQTRNGEHRNAILLSIFISFWFFFFRKRRYFLTLPCVFGGSVLSTICSLRIASRCLRPTAVPLRRPRLQSKIGRGPYFHKGRLHSASRPCTRDTREGPWHSRGTAPHGLTMLAGCC